MEETTKKRSWIEKLKSGVIVLGAIFTMFAIFFSGFQYNESTYAKESHLVFVDYKVDVKILDDRINRLQDREWALEDKLAAMDKLDPEYHTVNGILRKARAERERLNKELQIVIGKYRDAEEDIKH